MRPVSTPKTPVNVTLQAPSRWTARRARRGRCSQIDEDVGRGADVERDDVGAEVREVDVGEALVVEGQAVQALLLDDVQLGVAGAELGRRRDRHRVVRPAVVSTGKLAELCPSAIWTLSGHRGPRGIGAAQRDHLTAGGRRSAHRDLGVARGARQQRVLGQAQARQEQLLWLVRRIGRLGLERLAGQALSATALLLALLALLLGGAGLALLLLALALLALLLGGAGERRRGPRQPIARSGRRPG